MWHLRERLSYFRVKHLNTSSWWPYMYTQKIAVIFDITFKSHNGSWWQYNRPRRQILGKQIRPNFFCVRQVYFTNSCQQIWGCVNQLLYFLYITSEVKQYYLSYRPLTECGISQFFKTNCTQSIFRTINRGLLAKPFKKFSKSPTWPAGSHF